MKIVYIAGAYRGCTGWDVERNVQVAEALAYEVAALGAVPLCPHTMYRNFAGTLTDNYWLEATMLLLYRCDAILLCPNWRRSEGTQNEFNWAMHNRLPSFYDLDELKVWLGV